MKRQNKCQLSYMAVVSDIGKNATKLLENNKN